MDAIEAAVVLTTEWMNKVPLTSDTLLNEKAICKAYGEFYRTVISLNAEREAGRLDNLPFEWEVNYPTEKTKMEPLS